MPDKNAVTVTFLGGLGDIGRNCAVIETADALLILDCGQLFSGIETPGVDAILPDLDYLIQRQDKIVGCIATHGHEDHIGAIAYLYKAGLRFPIWSSPFTLGLIAHRLDEAGYLRDADFREVHDNEPGTPESHQIGPFSVEFLRVTHSVPGGYISAITTPQGVILHSSDFKLDPTPIDGRITDLPRIREISADPGIRLMLADSTNSDQDGSSQSESNIGVALEDVFAENEGRRVIVAAFSSHVHRVQQIVDAARAAGRTIATLGLSMKKNTGLARRLDILDLPDRDFIDISDIDDYQDGEICIVSTGSQGEPGSALSKAAEGKSKWMALGANDTVVLSSHPIPGNEERVYNMINRIVRVDAKVIHSRDKNVHTTGHGKRGELTELHRAAKPEWFTPVHGEEMHLRAHARLGADLGVAEEKVLLARDGDQVVLEDHGLRLRHQVTPGTHLLVHGHFIGPDRGVVQERTILGEHGAVIAVVTVDLDSQELVGRPVITSRGWLDTPELSDIHAEIQREVVDAVVKLFKNERDVEYEKLSRVVRRATGSYVADRSRRRPMIVPIIDVI